ncbi:MAG: hypothetical protein IJS32_07465 [Kiritimatiellae bacterium]|nr:hypothetical protein [Kiritimatiellia bacterium]
MKTNRKTESKPVLVWVPKNLVKKADDFAAKNDLNRSQVFRMAIRLDIADCWSNDESEAPQ